MTPRRRDGALRLGLRLMLSTALGFALMFPLAALFDASGLPTFHSWGLAHGSFFSAWPTLAIIAFLLLGALPWWRLHDDTPLLVVAAVIGLGLTSIVTVTLGDEGVLTVLCAVAMVVAVLLCLTARRRWLVALLVLLPVLFMKLHGPFLTLPYSLSFEFFAASLWYGGLRSWIPMSLAVVAGTLMARLARRVWASRAN